MLRLYIKHPVVPSLMQALSTLHKSASLSLEAWTFFLKT